jgi:hypothetical protein
MWTALVGTGGFDELGRVLGADDEAEDPALPADEGPRPAPLLVDEQAARTRPRPANKTRRRLRRAGRRYGRVDVTGPG